MDNATTSYDWDSWKQQAEFNGETLHADQLQHSIKAVYGQGFDANRYLYRFFQRSCSLPAPVAMQVFINSSVAGNELKRLLAVTGDGAVTIEPENLIAVLGDIASLIYTHVSSGLINWLPSTTTKKPSRSSFGW